jgi:1,4-dihydroxy-2-naphthoate octaprenyltransferase
LRTLPLALSSIITGSFAAYSKSFNGWVFGLAILTTLLLQILSNLANDFGDSEKGTDNIRTVLLFSLI